MGSLAKIRTFIPWSSPPTCDTCQLPCKPFSTKAEGRPFYMCNFHKGNYNLFWDDFVGIHERNPICKCGLPMRWTKYRFQDGGFLRCSLGRCREYEPTEKPAWLESGESGISEVDKVAHIKQENIKQENIKQEIIKQEIITSSSEEDDQLSFFDARNPWETPSPSPPPQELGSPNLPLRPAQDRRPAQPGRNNRPSTPSDNPAFTNTSDSHTRDLVMARVPLSPPQTARPTCSQTLPSRSPVTPHYRAGGRKSTPSSRTLASPPTLRKHPTTTPKKSGGPSGGVKSGRITRSRKTTNPPSSVAVGRGLKGD